MAGSWLASLPKHSIFDPPPEGFFPSLSAHPSSSQLARPPSPALSGIFGSSASTSVLRSRKVHAREEKATAGGRKSRMVVARGVDLIVAVGPELRIASLADVKTRCDERAEGRASSNAELEREVQLGDYKTLHTPAITFDIQQLVLNSTSKLLAVVGQHSVAVVVLPRQGWVNSIAGSLECRSLLVGAFYHALPASPSVAQVAWHPWGDNSSSLLVLTVDATLREYSIGYDAEEPAQTVDLRPSESRGRGGFSSDDAGEGTAVAFCLGEGKGDWRPLTLYALMRSGDIVAVCPFLPKKAAVPSSYIHALSVFVSTKIESPTPSDLDNSLSLALSTTSNHSPIVAQSPNAALQLKYVKSLVHQATLAHSNPPTDVEDPHLVRIVAPRLVGHPHPTRQGPFLLQPAPAELNNGHESLACDLAYISYPAPGTPGLGVFAVSYSDGKVDVCLAVNKVEARWGDAPHEREELPALAVYETIDLGLAEEDPQAVGDLSLEDNYPTFAKDPLYPDTLYVYHALGAHCLLMAKWLDDLVDLTTSDADDEKRLAEAAHNFRAQTTTTVRWILKTASVDGEVGYPVVGLSPLNDIYLGYSILLLTSALQLVGIDLPLRVDASLLPSTTSSSSTPLPSRRGVSSDPPAYLSLLDAPFPSLPALEPRSSPLLPRLALKPPPNSSSHPTQGQPPEVIITPATLRFMGKAVETFRHEIRDLVAAADTVQCRLELQLRERKRQLAKLLELAQLSDGLRRSTGGREGLGGRLERVAQAQEALLGRMDRVLQRLMNAHQPVLSTYETRWFAELERLEKEVVAGGGGGGGEGTVEMRLERAVAQFESLRPALEDLKRKEEGKGAVNGARTNGVKAAESPATLGATQMHRLEAKLDEEVKLILEAGLQLQRLTSSLAALQLSSLTTASS